MPAPPPWASACGPGACRERPLEIAQSSINELYSSAYAAYPPPPHRKTKSDFLSMFAPIAVCPALLSFASTASPYWPSYCNAHENEQIQYPFRLIFLLLCSAPLFFPFGSLRHLIIGTRSLITFSRRSISSRRGIESETRNFFSLFPPDGTTAAAKLQWERRGRPALNRRRRLFDSVLLGNRPPYISASSDIIERITLY